MTKQLTARQAQSNPDFGRLVGITYTAASRIRTGARLPSKPTYTRMLDVFKPTNVLREQLDAAWMSEDAEEFSRLVREYLYVPDAAA